MTEVNPIPEGFPTVTPHLCVEGADGAIDFTRAYSAQPNGCARPDRAAPSGTLNWSSAIR